MTRIGHVFAAAWGGILIGTTAADSLAWPLSDYPDVTFWFGAFLVVFSLCFVNSRPPVKP